MRLRVCVCVTEELGIVTVTIPCVKISGKALSRKLTEKKIFSSFFVGLRVPAGVPKSSVPSRQGGGRFLRMLLRPVGTE